MCEGSQMPHRPKSCQKQKYPQILVAYQIGGNPHYIYKVVPKNGDSSLGLVSSNIRQQCAKISRNNYL